MRKLIITVFLFLLLVNVAKATNWYVTVKGNDANDGKTPGTAFRNLQKAANLVLPGDVVYIGGGDYDSEQPKGNSVLSIKRAGTKDAWITWKALPGQKPVLHPKGWGGIVIEASYQIIDGMTVLGNNDSITLLEALEDAKKPAADGYYNTNGIFVNGRNSKPDNKPHHVIIRNCVVSKCAGGGIAAIQTDYITVEDCRISENAWFMRYAGSGITTLDNWAFDNEPGYHTIIQRNYVWNNKTQVPWQQTGKLSDGNGIILDVTDLEQNGATNPNADANVKPDNKPAAANERPEWKNRALIANNLCAYNGGSGIHTFRTCNVDIINNTTYWNGQIVGYAELFSNNCKDIVIMNNIIVPRPAGKVTSNYKNTRVTWDYNLSPQPQTFFKAPHDIVADPILTDIEVDITKGNFSPAKGSKALNNGTVQYFQALDIKHKKRQPGKVDIGAFQH